MDFEVRKDRFSSGRTLVAERAAYFELVRQGVSSQQACRTVGISYRTGRKWRNGHYRRERNVRWVPPIQAAVPNGLSKRYLGEDERIVIADRLREKASIRAIARELGRSPSSVSREVRRNANPCSGNYRPHSAQQRAASRRPRPKIGKIAANAELRDAIQARLSKRWSPEQICHALRKAFPGRPEMHVCHETIYQALYLEGRGTLHRERTPALRTGRAMRKPRRYAQQRKQRYATPMVMISQRPAEAADRAVPGHWEGDLIIGKSGKSAIGTLVERSTRYLMLLHLPQGRNAEAVCDALLTTIAALPPHLKRSLTWDQGCEMGLHHEFTAATNMPVYFCDPASPWQRGSNENTNGLLRQYFPKATDLIRHDRDHLTAIADELNNRPRKTLGWQTPAERLAKLTTTHN